MTTTNFVIVRRRLSDRKHFCGYKYNLCMCGSFLKIYRENNNRKKKRVRKLSVWTILPVFLFLRFSAFFFNYGKLPGKSESVYNTVPTRQTRFARRPSERSFCTKKVYKTV